MEGRQCSAYSSGVIIKDLMHCKSLPYFLFLQTLRGHEHVVESVSFNQNSRVLDAGKSEGQEEV